MFCEKAHFDNNNVSGDDVASLNFLLLAIADDDGLQSDTRLELFDNVTSSLFLIPTDKGVLEGISEAWSDIFIGTYK